VVIYCSVSVDVVDVVSFIVTSGDVHASVVRVSKRLFFNVDGNSAAVSRNASSNGIVACCSDISQCRSYTCYEESSLFITCQCKFRSAMTIFLPDVFQRVIYAGLASKARRRLYSPADCDVINAH
jgi:hypothetical protein